MTMLVTLTLARNLKIFTSTLAAIALVLTVYRMIYRYAIHRWWWEDWCAVIALIGSIICVVTSWSQFELAGRPSVISFWIHALTFPSVVWSVRLSILFSILRITSPLRNCRRVIIFIAGLFVLMWLSLVITFVGIYVSGYRSHTTPSQQDKEGTQSMAIFELINILSDCTLISLPIHLLRSVNLPYSQRRLIIAAFSSSIIVTIVSFFRAACVFNISPLISVAIDVEVACSLFVCNSLFITTLVYRMRRRNDAATDADTNVPTGSSHSAGAPKEALELTTIDLDAFGSITSGSISASGLTTTFAGDGTEKSCTDIVSFSYGEV